MFTLPHGIRIDAAGNVWTVDAATSVVYKFDQQGSKLLQIDVGNVPKESCGVGPTVVDATDVEFGSGGQVYVTDGYCNGRVLQFDATGRKLTEWGTRGSGPGAFLVAHSVAVSAQGRVFVADRENGRVHRFDPSGKHLGVWHYGPQVFSLAFNRDGNLYMSVRAAGAAETDMHIVQINRRRRRHSWCARSAIA